MLIFVYNSFTSTSFIFNFSSNHEESIDSTFAKKSKILHNDCTCTCEDQSMWMSLLRSLVEMDQEASLALKMWSWKYCSRGISVLLLFGFKHVSTSVTKQCCCNVTTMEIAPNYAIWRLRKSTFDSSKTLKKTTWHSLFWNVLFFCYNKNSKLLFRNFP